jgi:hypothetical protein
VKIITKLNNRPAISEIVNLCFNCGEFAIDGNNSKSIEFNAFKMQPTGVIAIGGFGSIE